MKKQQKKAAPRYVSFGRVAPNPEQHVVLNARVEQVVRAFLIGETVVQARSVPLNLLGEQQEAVIGEMNTCEGDIRIEGKYVAACARLGVSARKIMDNLIKVSVTHDGVTYPAVSIDNSKIISVMTAPIGAVYYAVASTIA